MTAVPKILLLNGPNLNLLGVREPSIYADATLPEIEARCSARAGELGLTLATAQSNSEGVLVDHIQAARDDCAGIIINPGHQPDVPVVPVWYPKGRYGWIDTQRVGPTAHPVDVASVWSGTVSQAVAIQAVAQVYFRGGAIY